MSEFSKPASVIPDTVEQFLARTEESMRAEVQRINGAPDIVGTNEWKIADFLDVQAESGSAHNTLNTLDINPNKDSEDGVRQKMLINQEIVYDLLTKHNTDALRISISDSMFDQGYLHREITHPSPEGFCFVEEYFYDSGVDPEGDGEPLMYKVHIKSPVDAE